MKQGREINKEKKKRRKKKAKEEMGGWMGTKAGFRNCLAQSKNYVNLYILT